MKLHYSNSKVANNFYLTLIYSTHALTSNPFWLVHAFSYPFVYQPTCTTLGLTQVRNQTNRVSGVDSQTSEGPTLGSWVTQPLSVLPSVPTSHSWNQQQIPCKPCTKQDTWNQKWNHLHLSASLFHSNNINQRGICLHWILLVSWCSLMELWKEWRIVIIASRWTIRSGIHLH